MVVWTRGVWPSPGGQAMHTKGGVHTRNAWGGIPMRSDEAMHACMGACMRGGPCKTMAAQTVTKDRDNPSDRSGKESGHFFSAEMTPCAYTHR